MTLYALPIFICILLLILVPQLIFRCFLVFINIPPIYVLILSKIRSVLF